MQKSFIYNNYQLIHTIQSTDFATIVLRLLLFHKAFEICAPKMHTIFDDLDETHVHMYVYFIYETKVMYTNIALIILLSVVLVISCA